MKLNQSKILVLSLSIAAIACSSDVFASRNDKCPGEDGYYYTNDKNKRNPRVGGFVSNSADVGDHVFIANTAAVCGSATVNGFARVYGNAIISGEAEVTDNARVYGDARVFGEALIAGDAKVSGNAKVGGDATVKGTAWVKGYTVLNSGTYAEGRISKEQSAESKRLQSQQQRQKKISELQSILSDIKTTTVDFSFEPWSTSTASNFYSYRWSSPKVTSDCSFNLRLVSYREWFRLRGNYFAPTVIRDQTVAVDLRSTGPEVKDVYKEKSRSTMNEEVIFFGRRQAGSRQFPVAVMAKYNKGVASRLKKYKQSYCM